MPSNQFLLDLSRAYREPNAGTHIGRLCQLIYHRQRETGLRRILGVLFLVKKYRAKAVESARIGATDVVEELEATRAIQRDQSNEDAGS